MMEILKLFIIQFSLARENYFTLNAEIVLHNGDALHSRSSITGRGIRFSSTPHITDPPSILFYGHNGLFPWV
jgi:hypothetical protein